MDDRAVNRPFADRFLHAYTKELALNAYSSTISIYPREVVDLGLSPISQIGARIATSQTFKKVGRT
jgi:hypothetical protein